MTGTLGSHMNICKALGVALADFYREIESDSKTISFIKGKEKHESFVYPKKSTTEILTTKVMTKKMMPLLIRVKKGGQTHKEENSPGTEKFIYLLEGNLLAEIGKEQHKLGRGDSLYLDASLPHVLKNSGKGEAIAVCVMTPPAY